MEWHKIQVVTPHHSYIVTKCRVPVEIAADGTTYFGKIENLHYKCIACGTSFVDGPSPTTICWDVLEWPQIPKIFPGHQ